MAAYYIFTEPDFKNAAEFLILFLFVALIFYLMYESLTVSTFRLGLLVKNLVCGIFKCYCQALPFVCLPLFHEFIENFLPIPFPKHVI